MKKIIIVVFALLLISACSPNNNNQLGTDMPRDHPNSTINNVSNVNNDRNHQGYQITRTNTGDPTNRNTPAPTRAGTNRDEQVAQVVTDSTAYVGQKMDGDAFIRRVFSHVGFHGFDVKNPYYKVVTYDRDALPGDILHLDLNGDGTVDQHAVLLDNGTMIHSNNDGIIVITDISNQPDLQNKVIHVQRVIKQ